ncbi:MAG TPA: UvrD-helicase domain-containing protein [Bacteroidota bacterium]
MSFLDDLNPVQREAVLATDGPVMIIAGAGSGKTRVLTYRVAYLVSRGVRPESILALTFTNKAAEEMKSRIVALVGEESRNVWMGTFHSIFARILRIEAERIGYGRNYTIYDTDDSLARIKSVMNQLSISQQQFPSQAVRGRISMAKNQLMDPQEFQRRFNDPISNAAAMVFPEYNAGLQQANAMDFDDLLLKPLELFTRHKDVLQRYQRRFQYILVDEYQDTNRAQYRLIQELARAHRNICVVGDDAQSIYAFRGADIRNILDFEKDYPDCKVFRLEQNYRSTKTILAAADSLIKKNRDQIRKTLWTSNTDGELVTVEIAEDDREEGRRVVARIEEEIARRKLSLRDVAVLYRTNAQSRSIEDALRRAGIPYVIIGGVAFYKRKEIKDILAYLKLIVNPRDAESLLRVINVPARGIGDTTIRKLSTYAREHELPLLRAIRDVGLGDVLQERALKSLRGFAAMIEKYIALRDQMSASELARGLVDEIGILNELKEEGTAEARSRADNIRELVSALSEFCETRQGATLEQFLEEVSLVSDVDTADFTRNAVTLMTLHAAKGLEFPVVFITGLEEGLFPLGSAAEEPADLEEERRLMYVGLTRAREKVYLSYALMRYRYGESAFSTKSRFLDEIDEAVLDRRRASARAETHGRSSAAAALGEAGFSQLPSRRRAADQDAAGDPMPDYESESQEFVPPKVGARVFHDSFGKGRIVALEGRGENTRAVVDFENVGRKNLMLKYARLRLR